MYIFTLYRISVIILTPPPLHTHIHSIVKLCRKGVLQTKREAFFKKMCFQIFLERGERWRAVDVCRKRVPDFSRLKVERSVSIRFKVSFGDFQQFAAGPKSLRGLVGVKQFWKVQRKRTFKVPESQCGNFVVDTVLYSKPVSLSEFSWQETKGRGLFLLGGVDN